MNKKELIDAMASNAGVPRVDAERALAGLLELIRYGRGIQYHFLDLTPLKSGTVPPALVESKDR
jgi:hypothetical protein